jgi:hypothetical protein
LIDVTDSEIKSAAEFIKYSANRVSEIEARLRDIDGGLEYISKRKLKNIKIELKNTSAQEAAAFIALSR